MMNNFTSSAWMWGFHLHWIFGLALVVGIVLLIIWTTKSLKPAELKTWVIWLLIIGFIGTLLTSGMGWGGGGNMMGGRGWGNMMGGTNWSNNINWQSMAEHMSDKDHSELNTPEEWRGHMLKEMDEYMGW